MLLDSISFFWKFKFFTFLCIYVGISYYLNNLIFDLHKIYKSIF